MDNIIFCSGYDTLLHIIPIDITKAISFFSQSEKLKIHFILFYYLDWYQQKN